MGSDNLTILPDNIIRLSDLTPITGDLVAIELVDYAAKQLALMLTRMVTLGNFSPGPLYFFGGTFKLKNADQYIQAILDKAGLQAWHLFVQNVQANPTTLLVQKLQ